MRAGVFAIGTDRPGIVAAITGAIVAAGGNLADTAMTILSGQFAMVLIVDDVTSIAALADAVAQAGAPLDITTLVRPVTDAGSVESSGTPCIVSVHGADRPGIVHRVASLLAERRANILDLRTHVVGTPDAPVYTMVLETELPPAVTIETIDAAVRVLAVELGIDAHAHGVNADLL